MTIKFRYIFTIIVVTISIVLLIHSIFTAPFGYIYAGCIWSLSQIARCISPIRNSLWLNRRINLLEEKSWLAWERIDQKTDGALLPTPTLDMHLLTACLKRMNQKKTPSLCMSELLGNHWIKDPVLIRNLWTKAELASPMRLLSIYGLQTNMSLADMIIPYYTDSSRKIGSTTAGYNYLSPDASARLGEIIYNITTMVSKAKIASQLIVEKNPYLIQEILPPKYIHIISDLFGDVFQPKNLVTTGPFGMLPAWTTVPIFIARSHLNKEPAMLDERKCLNSDQDECMYETSTVDHDDHHPRTDLHCEPIGNIAVQLEGQKRWSLVSPQYSSNLRPSVSRHGRAFFFSMLKNTSNLNHVPHYEVITQIGDALWVSYWNHRQH